MSSRASLGLCTVKLMWRMKVGLRSGRKMYRLLRLIDSHDSTS